VTTTDTDQETLPRFPPPRENPLDPPPLLLEYQRTNPVAPMAMAEGKPAYIVTRFEDCRQVLLSDAFSSDPARPGYPRVLLSHSTFSSAGQLHHLDPPEHDHYRRMLAPEFLIRRVEALKPAIDASVNQLIDTMIDEGPVADLITKLTMPVPAIVTCTLLGVPYERSDYFVGLVDTFLGGWATPEQVKEGRAELRALLGDLIKERTAEPAEDLLSRVIVAQVQPGNLDPEILLNLAELLLAAGFDTTHNTIGLGILALLQNPDQLDLLKSDWSLIDGAVEEILRHQTVPQFGRLRVVARDIEIIGHQFHEGDGVIAALDIANRDPSVFPNPHQLDIKRGQPHLGFGYGIHQCLGAMFARIELRSTISTLFQRIPDLRLAVPFSELDFKWNAPVFGLKAMPVTWDTTVGKAG
jgi:cytochrome P450